jgi:hypothetical protein
MMLRGWRKVTDIYETSLYPWMETEAVSERDGDLALTITGVWEGELSTPRGKEPKVAVRFRETSKLLILNKTNASTLWELFGRKIEGWIGQRVALYTKRVKVGREMKDAIRIRAHRPEGEAPSSAEERGHGPVEGEVGPTEFWGEFNTLKAQGKLPPDLDQGRIQEFKEAGDWAGALQWIRGEMQV